MFLRQHETCHFRLDMSYPYGPGGKRLMVCHEVARVALPRAAAAWAACSGLQRRRELLDGWCELGDVLCSGRAFRC